jgi:TonB family protein
MLNIAIGADDLLLLGLDHASVQRQAGNGNWYGKSRNRLGLAKIAIAGSPTLLLEDIRFDTHHLRGAQFDELRYTGGVHKTSMAGVEIDDIRFGMRIVKFDGNGYAALKKSMTRLQSQAGNGAQQATAMLQHMQKFTMETINAGAAIVIDELGASYRGHRASLKGQIGFNTLSERDMERGENVAEKLDIRFDIRLPLPLIQEISQAVGQHLGRSDARQIGDQLVGRLVADGYASIVKHELRTTMRLKQNKLSFNGKFFSQLPPPARPSDDAAATEERLVSPTKIAARCPPFTYPADAPKSYATASFQVGNDGQARWASILDSSGSPALDAAILTSVGACAWRPATYRGAAIAVSQIETFGDDPRARPAMP